MNYRHSYHAGNFSDVLKHSILALCLRHLVNKEAPFFVLDTHAGTGIYDLTGTEAQKTAEAQLGIGRLFGDGAQRCPGDTATLLSPYLDIVCEMNPHALASYPGSPEIARRMTRPQDRLVFCELHAHDAEMLARNMGRDRRIRVESIDGWQALKSLLPPPERRGLVLVDPSFEERDELARMARAFAQAIRRFATGMYLLWYPIKDRAATDRLAEEVRSAAKIKLLRAELLVRPASDAGLLIGTGLIVANPPFTLEDQLKSLLPALAGRLQQGSSSDWHLEWLQNA